MKDIFLLILGLIVGRFSGDMFPFIVGALVICIGVASAFYLVETFLSELRRR